MSLRQDPQHDVHAPPTSWSIRIAKEYHKFSAAHFLIFGDGTAERLHGHNYRVALEIESRATAYGMVMDFKPAKDLLRAILDRLDERVLLPARHPVLSLEARGEEIEVRYADKRYVFPGEDVVQLPIENSSSEQLALWIGQTFVADCRARHPELAMTRVKVQVEETPGQHGGVTIDASRD